MQCSDPSGFTGLIPGHESIVTTTGTRNNRSTASALIECMYMCVSICVYVCACVHMQ